MPFLPISRWWYDIRRSQTLVIVVVFIAMMLDLVMLTTLEPSLPDILHRIELTRRPHNASLTADGTTIAVNSTILHTTRRAGMIIAAKPATEILANILIGFVVDRYGHKGPMVGGCVCNFVATLGFAWVDHFGFLVAMRVIQAIGSSLTVISGLALLACAFQNEAERTWANGIAFGGLSVGIIVGFPLGSTCFQFLGRPAPFLIIAALMVVDGVLRLVVVMPDGRPNEADKLNTLSACRRWILLLTDPYILLCLGINLMEHIGLGMVIATQAAWMRGNLKAEQWHVGVVLVFGAIFQFGAQFLAAMYSVRCGRWKFCMAGLLLTAIGYATYPLCMRTWHVLGPESLTRAGLGAILAALSPLLAYLSDLRHQGDYGALYGLYTASYNLGLVVGPLAGGLLLQVLGFGWMYRGMAVLLAAYSFLCLFFKHVESRKYKLIKADVINNNKYGTFVADQQTCPGSSAPSSAAAQA